VAVLIIDMESLCICRIGHHSRCCWTEESGIAYKDFGVSNPCNIRSLWGIRRVSRAENGQKPLSALEKMYIPPRSACVPLMIMSAPVLESK